MPPFQNGIYDWVLFPQGFQQFRIRGVTRFGFFAVRQLQLLEQYQSQLLGRTNVERMSCFVIDNLLYLFDLLGKIVTEFPNTFLIDQNAVMFHGSQDFCQLQFDLTELLHALLLYQAVHFLHQSRKCCQICMLAQCFKVRDVIGDTKPLNGISGGGWIEQIGADFAVSGKLHALLQGIPMGKEPAVMRLGRKGLFGNSGIL